MARFKDRISAARELTSKLLDLKNALNTVVLGLPRGGVVTAAEIAKELHLPLGFLVVKKIGVPGNSELAVGAVTADGGCFIDKKMQLRLGISDGYVESEKEKKRKEAQIRSEKYLKYVENPEIEGKTVILADDGIATGATMIAAVKSAIKRGVKRVVVAVPAVSCDNFSVVKREADTAICVEAGLSLSSVGEYYDDFPQVEDNEVIGILKNAENNFSH